MEATPIHAVRQRIEELYKREPLKQCEAKLAMVELIKLICQHDDNHCWVPNCQSCRDILDAEAALKRYGISYSEVMHLRDAVADLDDASREGMLADIAELPQPCEPTLDPTGTDS